MIGWYFVGGEIIRCFELAWQSSIGSRRSREMKCHLSLCPYIITRAIESRRLEVLVKEPKHLVATKGVLK